MADEINADTRSAQERLDEALRNADSAAAWAAEYESEWHRGDPGATLQAEACRESEGRWRRVAASVEEELRKSTS